MASIRSLSTSRHSENLSDRHLNRSSIPSIPHAQKKLTIPKSPSSIVSTTRRKSSRMSSKKDPNGLITSSNRLHSSNSTPLTDNNHDLSVEEMASLKLRDLSPRRPRARTPNNFSSHAHFDTDISYEEQPIDRTESASAKPSLCNNQYTLESFDAIRTVGTGKNFITKKRIFSIHRRILGTFGRVQVVHHRDTNKYYALKMMSIKRIIESKQIDHVRSEKDILSKINHPFLVRLYWTTHTNSLLYLLLEYIPGGELFQMMRKREKFDSKTAIFYASEVLLALDYLHHLDILYRDLKPVKFN